MFEAVPRNAGDGCWERRLSVCEKCGRDRLGNPCRTCGSTDRDKFRKCKRCASKRVRECARRREYGMSKGQYQSMLSCQSGLCAICIKPETITQHGKAISLSVDHNHETGSVRGLLCGNCNRGIGCLRNADNMRRAIEYLDKYDGNR